MATVLHGLVVAVLGAAAWKLVDSKLGALELEELALRLGLEPTAGKASWCGKVAGRKLTLRPVGVRSRAFVAETTLRLQRLEGAISRDGVATQAWGLLGGWAHQLPRPRPQLELHGDRFTLRYGQVEDDETVVRLFLRVADALETRPVTGWQDFAAGRGLDVRDARGGWLISGRFDGWPIELVVPAAGSGRTGRLRLDLGRPVASGLHLVGVGHQSRAKRRAHRGHGVVTGVAVLDGAVTTVASEPDEARAVLRRLAEHRDGVPALLSVLHGWPGAALDEGQIEVPLPELPEPVIVGGLLEDCAALAALLRDA